MLHRIALPLLLAFAAVAASAQQAAPPSAPASPSSSPLPSSTPAPATVRVSLQTSEGDIVLALEKERAPITTANFLRYVDQKRFDGTFFYRATRVAPGFGLIQGGTRNDPKRLLPPIAHEPTTRTGLSHMDGTISMARDVPGTATGDFFITVGDMPTMDADPQAPGDNAGFAAFGHVVGGMDVVRHILDDPTSPTEGEGVMKGQMLAPPVRIIAVRRLP
jgi:peptidyl-prolyl cis-trans isomerase A (cyclophilin A)